MEDQLNGLEGKDLELDSGEWLLNGRMLSAFQAHGKRNDNYVSNACLA